VAGDWGQGDQIVRILDYWAIVFFGLFRKITEVAQMFGLLYFNGISNLLILTKNGLGYILCDFFTDSSGRSDWGSQLAGVACKKMLALKIIKSSKMNRSLISQQNFIHYVLLNKVSPMAPEPLLMNELDLI
jgi:hypothetical protein